MDSINVRFAVTAGFSITLAVDSTDRLIGERLRGALAENLDRLITDAGGIREFIEKVTIEEVATDEDETIVEAA